MYVPHTEIPHKGGYTSKYVLLGYAYMHVNIALSLKHASPCVWLLDVIISCRFAL